MSTSYISAKTAAENGAEFTLSSGSSRTFFATEDLAPGEALTLEIKETNGGTFQQVGKLCFNGQSVGVVTARGEGSSTFRVVKPVTTATVGVFFD